MAISVLHLPTDVDLSNKEILLRPHMVYVGKAISNLQQSLLHKELPEKAYKSWLWAEIKAKSNIHQALVEIKQALISKLDITLVCSCLQNGNCPANTIKKAIGYLIEQDKVSTSQELSFDEFTTQLSINEDTLHDFYVWLENNQISPNKVSYPNTWLCYVSLNLQTI